MQQLFRSVPRYTNLARSLSQSYTKLLCSGGLLAQQRKASSQLSLPHAAIWAQPRTLSLLPRFAFSDKPESKEKKNESLKEKFEYKTTAQPQSKGDILRSEADSLKSIGKFQEAIPLYEEALKEFQKENNYPGIEGTSLQLGMSYNYVRKFQESLNTFKNLMEVQLKKYPKTHFFIGSTHINIGAAYNNLRQFNKAREEIEKGIEIVKQNIGEKHLIVASAHYGLGFALHYMGILDKAR